MKAVAHLVAQIRGHQQRLADCQEDIASGTKALSIVVGEVLKYEWKKVFGNTELLELDKDNFTGGSHCVDWKPEYFFDIQAKAPYPLPSKRQVARICAAVKKIVGNGVRVKPLPRWWME